jgi:hypothetical protein
MLERWNGGIMGIMKNVDPTFFSKVILFAFLAQYSTIPSFHVA